jgi:hypothetical protein
MVVVSRDALDRTLDKYSPNATSQSADRMPRGEVIRIT